MRPSRLRALVATVLLAAALVACGNDDEDDVGELPTPAPETPETEVEAEPTPTPTPTPTPETTVYEVQEGDTLGAIAAQFDTTVDAIVEANDLDDPDAIFIGDELVIPTGEDAGADADVETDDGAADEDA
jgi:LysM repeat protein